MSNGVSAERIRQLEKNALKKLRKLIENLTASRPPLHRCSVHAVTTRVRSDRRATQ